ncbi:MAG: class II fructose-bisphosphate aldolase [Oscillospiraceae bacterium]
MDDARCFLEEVTVEALAIGIGNAHGIYKSTPNLAFDRLEQVAALGGPALVLHGGSGIPDDMIRKAIVMGIRKINVATEVRLAFLEGFGLEVNSKDIYKAYQSAQAHARKIISDKMSLFDTTK